MVVNKSGLKSFSVPHKFLPVLEDTIFEKLYAVFTAMFSDVRNKYLKLLGDPGYVGIDPTKHKKENPLAKGGLVEFLIFWNLGAVTIVVLYYLLVWLYKRGGQMKHYRKMPGPRVKGWTGNIANLSAAPTVRGQRDALSLIQGYSKQYFSSGLFRLWHYHPWLPTSKCLVFVHDNQLVRQILQAEKMGDVDKAFVRESLGPLAGRGLFSSQDKHQWQCMRA
jgi:hypothetical protein